MIIERTDHPHDLQACADIWLEASIAAHDFVDPDFWAGQQTALLEEYLPQAELYVAREESSITGFAALRGDVLAALFVRPGCWGRGIGSKLVAHIKARREKLELGVYKLNRKAVRFYQKNDFALHSEQLCRHTGQAELLLVWRKGP